MKHQNISVTGSLNLNGVGVATTANLNAYTASSNSKVDALIAQTGSYATTGSNTFTGAQVVQGTLTAQTIVVQTVTSSVLFTTGSNKLGSSLSNVQELTGSVGITGSLAINGTTAVVGSGTVNYVPKFTASGTIGNSAITDDGTTVTLVSRALAGTSATFSGLLTVTNNVTIRPTSGYNAYFQTSGTTLRINYLNDALSANISAAYRATDYSFQDASGGAILTLASTGAATFSSSVTAGTGGYLISGDNSIFLNNISGTSSQQIKYQNNGTIKFQLYLDSAVNSFNVYNNAQSSNSFTIASTGAATFSNTETTFNFNTQTSLLAGYNYLNFGGGSIMYRNNTDIYIGSNAKYGASGTVVAGYTSAAGMGLVAIDGGAFYYQANATSVTAGTAYSVPTRFYINGNGNVGIGTITPAAQLQVSITSTSQPAAYIEQNSAFNGLAVTSSGNAGTYYIANFRSTGVDRMRIFDNGNVGIGTTSAASYYSNKLVVSAAAEDGITIAATTITSRNFLAFADGTAGEDRYRGLLGYNHADDSMLFYTNANQRMIISSNGSIGAPSGTNIYNASDVRLKKNISTTTYGLDAISALNPVKFNWVDGFEPSEDGKDMLGFVAQEVQEVIPEAVESFGGNSITVGDTVIENPLRVNEKFIIPVLVKAIQEQQVQIEELKTLLKAK